MEAARRRGGSSWFAVILPPGGVEKSKNILFQAARRKNTVEDPRILHDLECCPTLLFSWISRVSDIIFEDWEYRSHGTHANVLHVGIHVNPQKHVFRYTKMEQRIDVLRFNEILKLWPEIAAPRIYTLLPRWFICFISLPNMFRQRR